MGVNNCQRYAVKRQQPVSIQKCQSGEWLNKRIATPKYKGMGWDAAHTFASMKFGVTSFGDISYWLREYAFIYIIKYIRNDRPNSRMLKVGCALGGMDVWCQSGYIKVFLRFLSILMGRSYGFRKFSSWKWQTIDWKWYTLVDFIGRHDQIEEYADG